MKPLLLLHLQLFADQVRQYIIDNTEIYYSFLVLVVQLKISFLVPVGQADEDWNLQAFFFPFLCWFVMKDWYWYMMGCTIWGGVTLKVWVNLIA